MKFMTFKQCYVNVIKCVRKTFADEMYFGNKSKMELYFKSIIVSIVVYCNEHSSATEVVIYFTISTQKLTIDELNGADEHTTKSINPTWNR